VLGDQEQRLYRRTPCRRVVLVPRQLGHEVSGIAQDAQLTAAGQGMGSSKVAVPVFVGHRAVRPLHAVVWIALSYFLNTMLSMATTPAARAGALGVADRGRRTIACVSAAHVCARSSRVYHSSIRSRRTERAADRDQDSALKLLRIARERHESVPVRHSHFGQRLRIDHIVRPDDPVEIENIGRYRVDFVRSE